MELQPVEAQTLTRVEVYQLCCCGGAETNQTNIWWNLGVIFPKFGHMWTKEILLTVVKILSSASIYFEGK